MEPIYIILGIAIFIAILIIGMYNGLVRVRNHCDEAWSGIDTELKRRYDLVPNLVSAVKGYARHERETLEEVTRLRNVCALNHGTPEQQAKSENGLIQSLGKLIALVEQYPQLQADQHFLELQKELVITEDRIQAARRFYNGNVRELNTKVQSFPSNLIANLFKFELREFFQIEDLKVRETPKVELGESSETPAKS